MSVMIIKRVAMASLLGLSIVLGLLALVIFTVNDATLVGWLVQQVESSTGAQISYRKATVHRGLTPTLEVIQLQVSAGDGRYHIETASLQLSVSLPYMLLARLDIPSLQIGATQVSLKAGKAPPAVGGFSIGQALGALHFKPVLHDLRIVSVSVSAEGAEWRLPAGRVNEISLQMTADEETPLLSADVNLETEKLHIDVTLPDFRQALQRKHLPFSVKVKGIHANGDLGGNLDFTGADTTLELKLQARAADLSHYSLPVADLHIPGTVNMKADIAGTLDQLTAENVHAHWQDAAGTSADLNGRVGDVLALSSLDFRLTGDLVNAAWLQPVLPDSLGVITKASVSSTIGGTRGRLSISGLQLNAKNSDAIDLQLSGGFELAANDKRGYQVEHINAALNFSAPTTRAARALLFEQIPELGAVQGSADIRSVAGDPAFENVNVKTHSETGIEAGISGRIAQFPLHPEKPNRGYDLDVSINAGQAQVLGEAVNLDVAMEGPLRLRFKIQGDTPALQLNAIELAAGSDKALQLNATGHAQFGDWSREDPLQSLALLIDADSHDTQALGRFLQTDGLPEMGALKLHGRVHTVAGKHRVDDFYLRTVKAAAVQVALTGSVSDLILFPAPMLKGLELDFVAQGEDTAALNPLFGLKPARIPSIGNFKIVSTVTGSNKSIYIANTRINAGHKALLAVTAQGRLGKLDADSSWSFYDTGLKLEAQSDSSQALVKTWGYQLPSLGPLSATAEIRDQDGTLGLDELQLSVGGQQAAPVVIAQGRIGELTRGANVDIDVKLNIDGHNLAAFADRRQLEDMAPLSGHLHIADTNGVLGMQTLSLNSSHEALSVDVNGQFTDFSKPETLSLNVGVKARDLALIGALFDQEWPALSPFNLRATLAHDSHRHTHLQANLSAAKKTLDADLQGDFNSTPPLISGKVTARQVGIPDYYQAVAREREAQKKVGKKTKKKTSQTVFSREAIAFEPLKKLDLDLDVGVVSFDADESGADSAALKISLKSGLLRIHPAVITYAKGVLDLDLLVDARQQPHMRFSAQGKNIDPWQGMTEQPGGSDIDLNADYDVDIQLSASGRSPHELASSLDGDLFLTMKQGRIRSSALNLLFVDIVGWASNRVRNQKFDKVICGVADFSAKQGVISTNAFFLDLRDIAITGKGDIDLGKETVAYVFLPRKKSRLVLKAEPVNVKGPLANPKVTAIPVKSAALNFGTLIFAPYVFAGLAASDYVGGKLQSDKNDSPCLNYEKAHNKVDPNLKVPQTTD